MPLKPSEIMSGKTYRGKSGPPRLVNLVYRSAHFGERRVDYYRVPDTVDCTPHNCSRPAFARWAVEEVRSDVQPS